MTYVGAYVKITDSYEGNIRDVIGKVGKVVARDGDLLALDIRGCKKDQDHTYWDYNVVVTESEIEVQNPEFKDSKDQLVEIGDIIVYGPLGGGITTGKVVDIKESEQYRWGRSSKVVKVRVEIDSENYWSDGDRKVQTPSKTYRWYDHGGRMLVIRKGSMSHLISMAANNCIWTDQGE